jgi:hypothetical protein
VPLDKSMPLLLARLVGAVSGMTVPMCPATGCGEPWEWQAGACGEMRGGAHSSSSSFPGCLPVLHQTWVGPEPEEERKIRLPMSPAGRAWAHGGNSSRSNRISSNAANWAGSPFGQNSLCGSVRRSKGALRGKRAASSLKAILECNSRSTGRRLRASYASQPGYSRPERTFASWAQSALAGFRILRAVHPMLL